METIEPSRTEFPLAVSSTISVVFENRGDMGNVTLHFALFFFAA